MFGEDHAGEGFGCDAGDAFLRIGKMSVSELLKLYADILKELRTRKVIRSSNSPLGDYTEDLVCKKLGLHPSNNSNAGFDATDNRKRRYQIKSRRLTPENSSTQLGAIRDLDKKPFDFLVGVVFKPDFEVDYAAMFTCEFIKKHAKYVRRTNSWRFLMKRQVLKMPGVVNVTSKLSH